MYSGDDVSLSSLLQYRVPLPDTLPALYSHALSMNYSTIASKLHAILTQSGTYEQLFAPPYKNEFWPTVTPSGEASAYANQDADYIDLGFAPPVKYDIPKDVAAPADITRQCRVDIIDASASLPAATELMQKYQHTPVILRGLLNSSKRIYSSKEDTSNDI